MLIEHLVGMGQNSRTYYKEINDNENKGQSGKRQTYNGTDSAGFKVAVGAGGIQAGICLIHFQILIAQHDRYDPTN